jgi:GTPase SAR1 family protein
MEQSLAQTGLEVMRQFHSHRARIIKVLEGAQSDAAAIHKDAKSLHSLLERTKTRISEKMLRLSIVGPEGHGKSTFVNGLLGGDFGETVPTDPDWPGTVAPVVIEGGANNLPEYVVELLAGKSQPIANLAEFGKYLLQKHNHDNSKGVARGIVRLAHPLLNDVLKIVDMPGTRGVSAEIRTTVAEDLKLYTISVIAIARKRMGYPALIELFKDYQIDPKKALLVINIDDDDADEVRTLQVPLNRTVAKHFDELRNSCIGIFAREGIKLDRYSVFLACAPYLNQPDRPPLHALHAAEVAALRDAVWSRLRETSAAAIVRNAVAEAIHALYETRKLYSTRKDVISDILGAGDEPEQRRTGWLGRLRPGSSRKKELDAALRKAIQLANGNAKRHFDATSINRAAAEAWDRAIKDKVVVGQGELLRFLNDMNRRIESKGHIDGEEGKRLKQEIVNFVTEKSKPIEEARNTALRHFAEAQCEHGTRLIAFVYTEIKVLSEVKEEDRIVILPSDFQNIPVSEADPNFFAIVAKAAAGTAGAAASALGLKGAALAVLYGAGVVAPPLAVVAGLAAAGVAVGWYATDLFMGKKGDLKKFIRKQIEAVALYDGSESSPLYEQWRTACVIVASETNIAVNNAFSTLENWFSAPERREDLEKMLGALNRASERVGQHIAALDSILAEVPRAQDR